MQTGVSAPSDARKSCAELDRARGEAVAQASRNLLSQIAAVQKLLRIYDRENATVLQAGDGLIATLGVLFEDAPVVEIKMWRDCVFVNGDRLRCDISNFAAYKHVLGQAQRTGLEKIIFRNKIGRGEAIGFFAALEAVEASGARGPDAVEAVAREDFENAAVTASQQLDQQLDDLGVKPVSKPERARRAFYSALSSAKDVLTAQTSQGAASLRKAKRAVQSAVDILLEDESSLLALAAIKDHDEYTFTHSVNVCVFSLAIGHALGFHRSCLSKLGVAALFHDIGKTTVPQDVLNKIGVLNVDEWKTIREHTVMGVRQLARMPRCNEHVLHSLIVAFQHHLNVDLSGYPGAKGQPSLDLFSRIVRIADTFDAMTTERPYRNKVYSPYEAMRYLISQAGSKFDPILVKAFARAIGVFPIGTVVRLSTGEIGVVVRRGNLSTEPTRPMMKMLLDRDGKPAPEGRMIDLGQTDPGTGEFAYSVAETLSCKDLGINLRDHLMP
jgi:HD-GYP domain-containing protein (c-di-GMP phosphodiesterase class II)